MEKEKKLTEWSLLGKVLAGVDMDHNLTPASRAIIDEVRLNLHGKTIDAYYYSHGKKISEQHHLEKD